MHLTNSTTGEQVFAPSGFSWTTLFFNGFPLLFRGDIKGGLIIIGITSITLGTAHLIFPFMANNMHKKHLFKKGFVSSYMGGMQNNQAVNVVINNVPEPVQEQEIKPEEPKKIDG